ncbi:hypothetical protein Bca101_043303 [Brassica carinata]
MPRASWKSYSSTSEDASHSRGSFLLLDPFDSTHSQPVVPYSTFISLRLGRAIQSVVRRLIRFWDSRNKNGEFMGITILLPDELIKIFPKADDYQNQAQPLEDLAIRFCSDNVLSVCLVSQSFEQFGLLFGIPFVSSG